MISKWKRFRNERRNRGFQSLAVFFILALSAFFILNLLHEDRDFSASENRELAGRPTANLANLADGTFMEEYEAYEADQFIFRDRWISLKLRLERMLGRKEFNGVYLGEDDYLMEKPGKPDEENIKRNLAAISNFAARHEEMETYLALVPNAAYILKDKLPSGAPVRNQAKDIADIKNALGADIRHVDLLEVMRAHADENIYYHTDHHWTSLGARYGFEALAAAMGIENPAEDYTVYTVSETFEGTLASKSGYHEYQDSVEIYEPQGVENRYIVHNPESGEKTATLYHRPALEEKDKYTVFMGGNHARADIETTNQNHKVLLMLKDSYANCLVPFLTPYYQEIIVIDPRYYYEDIESLIERKGVTQTLFLYNVNTFLQDSAIADVLAAQETTIQG